MAEAQLKIVDGPNAGREFDLSGAVVLGRDPSAGIVLEDPEASRRHASLSVEGGTVSVEDLGSTNGTFVNGERVSGSRSLSDGDKVRIGTTVLEVNSLIQATRIGTAIPDEGLDVQATAIGHEIREEPAPEPVPAERPTDAGVPQPTGGPTPGAVPPVPAPGGPPGAAPPGPPPGAAPPGPPPGAAPPGPPPGPPAGPPGGPPPGFGGPPPGGPPPGGPPPGGPPGGPPPGGPPPGFGGPPPGPPGPPPGYGAPAQGAAPPAPGMPPVPAGMVAAMPQVEYPIKMYAYYPADGQVGRSSFRGLRTLPHVFALAFIGIGVAFARFYAWFVILFTGRLPESVFNFELGYLRWAARVAAYRTKLTAIPPPFGLDDDPNYPVRVEAVYPQSIPRWHVFVSGIMLIPHYVMLFFLGIGAAFGALFGSLAVLFTGRYPPGVFKFVLGTMRWRFRVHGFRWHWTAKYPPFSTD